MFSSFTWFQLFTLPCSRVEVQFMSISEWQASSHKSSSCLGQASSHWESVPSPAHANIVRPWKINNNKAFLSYDFNNVWLCVCVCVRVRPRAQKCCMATRSGGSAEGSVAPWDQESQGQEEHVHIRGRILTSCTKHLLSSFCRLLSGLQKNRCNQGNEGMFCLPEVLFAFW